MARGSIIKREGKRGVSYLIKYDAGRDPQTGKRLQRYKTFATKKEAERELGNLVKQVNDGTHVDPSKMTLGDWITDWLKDHAAHSVSQRTLEGYRGKLETYVAPRLGRTAIQKLTAPAIQKLYSDLLAAGRAPKRVAEDEVESSQPPATGLSSQSVLHVHRVLFQCLKTAVRQRVLIRNPAEDVTPPNPQSARNAERFDSEVGSVRALDKHQLPALFAAFAGHPLLTLVAIGLATGLRRGELLALNWSDIDLDAKTLRVNKAIDLTKRFGLQVKNRPKNKASRRTIGIDEDLCNLLRAHSKEQKELALKLGVPYPRDCLVFPSLVQARKGRPSLAPEYKEVDFNRLQNPDNVSKEFSRTVKAAGFEEFSFHDLRHTHATLLLIDRVPVHAVAHRLGHSTPVITMQTYAHVLQRAEDQAVAISGDILRAAMSSNPIS